MSRLEHILAGKYYYTEHIGRNVEQVDYVVLG